MKTIYKYIMCAFVALVGLASCDKNDDTKLNLSGDCLVDLISLDGVEGMIDRSTRSLIIRVPESTVVDNMKVTELNLSNGAKANISVGDVLDMNYDHNVHVVCGDKYLDWTLSVVRNRAQILKFVINDIYQGMIDEAAKTITVYVPGSVDITKAKATVEVSQYAEVSPASGVTENFSEPKVYTVTNMDAKSEYTVTVIRIEKPKALFVGDAADMSKLDPEAQAACLWMLANVDESMYMSFDDIMAGNIDLSDVKLVWWHFHKDNGVDGHDPFILKAPKAIEAKDWFKEMYNNGVNFLMTRYATIYPSFFGVTGDDEWTTPNNCWGGTEATPEICGGPWEFIKAEPAHPIFANTIAGDDPNRIYLTDKGYGVTNSTAQYHIGTDWGGFDNDAAWCQRTGGKILGKGGDGAIVAWEYPAHDGKGGLICIGSGCYDWYAASTGDDYVENFHKNVATITLNAINYLTK